MNYQWDHGFSCEFTNELQIDNNEYQWIFGKVYAAAASDRRHGKWVIIKNPRNPLGYIFSLLFSLAIIPTGILLFLCQRPSFLLPKKSGL